MSNSGPVGVVEQNPPSVALLVEESQGSTWEALGWSSQCVGGQLLDGFG